MTTTCRDGDLSLSRRKHVRLYLANTAQTGNRRKSHFRVVCHFPATSVWKKAVMTLSSFTEMDTASAVQRLWFIQSRLAAEMFLSLWNMLNVKFLHVSERCFFKAKWKWCHLSFRHIVWKCLSVGSHQQPADICHWFRNLYRNWFRESIILPTLSTTHCLVLTSSGRSNYCRTKEEVAQTGRRAQWSYSTLTPKIVSSVQRDTKSQHWDILRVGKANQETDS